MTPDPFTQEQSVQRAIAIIQKTAHVSILQIHEPTIRQWIDRGLPSNLAAQQWIACVGVKS